MSRYLVTYSKTRNGIVPMFRIFSVSKDVGPEDVTYPEKTVLFFFFESDMPKEEVLKLLPVIKMGEAITVMINDKHFESVTKFYVPAENIGIIPTIYKAGNKLYTLEDLEGVVEVI